MKVMQNNSAIQIDAYIKQIQQQRQQPPQDVRQSGAVQQGTVDIVRLSSQAKAIHQTAFSMSQTEEVRDEKVRHVKMEIEKGTYQVNPAQVATDMLRETFENNKILNKIDTRA